MTESTIVPALLTVTEVARRLGVSRQRVHQRIQSGSLKAERVQSVTAAKFHYLLPADQFGEASAYAAPTA